MSLLLFLVQVFVISLSGVMAPGPVTAAAIAGGSRNRFAGILIGLGHVTVELPLIALLMLGAAKFIEIRAVQIAIGFVGGLVLLVMALQMISAARKAIEPNAGKGTGNPFMTGIVLSVSNPYFLLWWAAVGLNLITGARELGLLALVLFALVHWMCDCVWLQILSWAGFKGTALFGEKAQRIVLWVCGVAMALFGVKFMVQALRILLN